MDLSIIFPSFMDGTISLDDCLSPTQLHFPSPSPTLYGHLPTPSPSHLSSPPLVGNPIQHNDGYITVSVSTAFHPAAHIVDPDLIFSSSDMVLFYVHSHMLTSVSPNAFCRIIEEQQHYDSSTIPPPFRDAGYPGGIIYIPEASAVLNVILHMLYGTSSAQHLPTFDTLLTAVDRLTFYDINPKLHIIPKTPLYDLLLNHAPLHPLEIYAVAGKYDLYELAVTTSSHLLSFPLSDLPDELAQKMGAVYLKRLLCLHLDRFNKLKDILLQPPHPHVPTKECSFVDQRKLTRAWALVSAYLVWDARPELSTHSMQNALNPLTEHLACVLCQEALQNQIKDVVVQWVSVKRTI